MPTHDLAQGEVTGRILKCAIEVHQTLSYLKASGYRVALLLNFGAKQLQTKRLIYG